MALNRHLKDHDYRRAAQAIIDDTEWSDEDLVARAHGIVTDRLGEDLNEAELGEIWTHVIGLDFRYAVLAQSTAEAEFLALGSTVDYDEPEPEDDDEHAGDDPAAGCCGTPCGSGGQ